MQLHKVLPHMDGRHAFSLNIASYGQTKIQICMLRLMTLFILFSYLERALQSALHLRMEAKVIINDREFIGVIYKVFDIFITVLGTGLIASGRNNKNGVHLLLLQRTMQRLAFNIWNCDQILSDFVDIGCLLLLLAAHLSQSEEWHKRKQASLQRLLLLSRICLSCLYMLWYREKQSAINEWFAIFCLVWLVSGFCCKFASYLTICTLLWHLCCPANWNFIFGWNDLTTRVCLISTLLGRMGGFLLLGRYGAGKWSLDARWTS